VIDSVRDVLAPLGRVTHVGPSGTGQLAKLGNQQIVAVTIGAIAEAMLLVEAGGGSREAFRAAIRGGFAESRILELHGQRMIDRNFEPGGTSRNQLKDLDAVLAAARSLSLHLPLTETVRTEFAEFVENGGAESDHSGLLLHLENKNGRGKA
ncbi:NAD(P)-dependent oxidoreductase, partial [Agrobacterium sp. SHOUNA12C]|nr:NAD(P)-dependent oxidoreductase [Agrobacterium sp. SHOUNA12C]